MQFLCDSLGLLIFFVPVLWSESGSVSTESCQVWSSLKAPPRYTEIHREMTETELSLPVEPSHGEVTKLNPDLISWNTHLGSSWIILVAFRMHLNHWIKWIVSDNSASFSDWYASWVPSTHNTNIGSCILHVMIQWLFFNVFNALFHDIVYKVKVAGILPGELARCFGGLHFPTSHVDSLRLYVEHCQYCWLCSKRFWRLVNPYIFAFDESGESVLMSNSPPKQLHWLLRCKMFLLGWVDFGFPFLECQGGDQSKPFLAPSYFETRLS